MEKVKDEADFNGQIAEAQFGHSEFEMSIRYCSWQNSNNVPLPQTSYPNSWDNKYEVISCL